MNIKPYIESGILESYALDLLSSEERMGVERMLKVYPLLKKELEAIENALEAYALAHAIVPNETLAQTTLITIANLQKEKEMDINNLPLITPATNYLNWLEIVKNIDPNPKIDGVFTKLLRHDDQVTQLLVISETNIPEEMHEKEHESFLILKGVCNCIINGKTTLMGPGGYMAIPLNELHDVKLVSKQVTAILQHVKV